jgi:hypothetical protein
MAKSHKKIFAEPEHRTAYERFFSWAPSNHAGDFKK